MPWANKELNIYLVAPDRRPDDALNPFALEAQLKTLLESHGEVSISHVHVFSQLYLLEPGDALQDLLNIEHFLPRRMTVTVRHTDFWNWENDDHLHIDSSWVRRCRFPNSLVELKVDLESLERKALSVDYLADDAARGWFFTRKDGRRLVSCPEDIRVSTWTGQSTLNDERWIRDEERPGQLDYRIATITFRIEDREAVTELKREFTAPTVLRVPRGLHSRRCMFRPALPADQLKEAGVTDAMPAEEAASRMRLWEREGRPSMVRETTPVTAVEEHNAAMPDSQDGMSDQASEYPGSLHQQVREPRHRPMPLQEGYSGTNDDHDAATADNDEAEEDEGEEVDDSLPDENMDDFLDRLEAAGGVLEDDIDRDAGGHGDGADVESEDEDDDDQFYSSTGNLNRFGGGSTQYGYLWHQYQIAR